MDEIHSTPSRVVPEKLGSERSLQRILGESLAHQTPCDSGSPAQPLDQRKRSRTLRQQPGQCVGDRVGREPMLFQVGPDRRVPKAAAGECLRPCEREPGVVHVADALERLERVGPRILVNARLGQTIVNLLP